jgi:hypothetical protein
MHVRCFNNFQIIYLRTAHGGMHQLQYRVYPPGVDGNGDRAWQLCLMVKLIQSNSRGSSNMCCTCMVYAAGETWSL